MRYKERKRQTDQTKKGRGDVWEVFGCDDDVVVGCDGFGGDVWDGFADWGGCEMNSSEGGGHGRDLLSLGR